MDLHILAQQLVNGLVLGAIYGLIAVGYTMVYGVIGMVNFAHGDVYMLSAYATGITLAVLSHLGVDSVAVLMLATIAIVVVITAVHGWAVERLAYRPLRGASKLAPLISAIGVSLLLQSYANWAQGPNTQGIAPVMAGGFTMQLGAQEHDQVQISYVQTLIIVVAFASMGLLAWLINRTSMGRACRATQQDARMATLLGINTTSVVSLVFVIGAVMAGVAGVLVTLNYGSFDFTIGFVVGVKAFTAAVLGGIGSLPGALVGGLLLGMMESFFAGFVSSDYKDVFAFSVLILVLVFKPSGLFGKPSVEKV